MKTHDKNLKWKASNQCTICGLGFQRLSTLRFHLKDEHQITLKPTQQKTSNETALEVDNTLDSYSNNSSNNKSQIPYKAIENEPIYLDEIEIGAHTLTKTTAT